MENSDKLKYWLELAEYDFETARLMLDGGRYLYVGFMCHQAIEKVLKGYYVSILAEDPPFTHNPVSYTHLDVYKRQCTVLSP